MCLVPFQVGIFVEKLGLVRVGVAAQVLNWTLRGGFNLGNINNSSFVGKVCTSRLFLVELSPVLRYAFG